MAAAPAPFLSTLFSLSRAPRLALSQDRGQVTGFAHAQTNFSHSEVVVLAGLIGRLPLCREHYQSTWARMATPVMSAPSLMPPSISDCATLSIRRV